MSDLSEFLAAERPDEVAFFLRADAVDDVSALAEHAEQVGDGVVLVVPGDSGRSAFQSATGIDPMALARQAMENEGEIDLAAGEGVCPNEGDGDDHAPTFLFAFAEAQNEEVGGIYAEGDVIHAYAVCECGEYYSDKWVVGGE
ncbi:MAG: DUF5807 family protein [Haloarculaceae archaeon]